MLNIAERPTFPSKAFRRVLVDREIAEAMESERGVDWSAVAAEAFRHRLKLLRLQREAVRN